MVAVSATNSFDGLGSVVDGSLDEMALAVARVCLAEKGECCWTLSLMVVRRQVVLHRGRQCGR